MGFASSSCGRSPVGHDNSLESPFFSCHLCTQIIAVGRVNTIDHIVGCHDAHGLRSFHCNFKAPQVDLS